MVVSYVSGVIKHRYRMNIHHSINSTSAYFCCLKSPIILTVDDHDLLWNMNQLTFFWGFNADLMTQHLQKNPLKLTWLIYTKASDLTLVMSSSSVNGPLEICSTLRRTKKNWFGKSSGNHLKILCWVNLWMGFTQLNQQRFFTESATHFKDLGLHHYQLHLATPTKSHTLLPARNCVNLRFRLAIVVQDCFNFNSCVEEFVNILTCGTMEGLLP